MRAHIVLIALLLATGCASSSAMPRTGWRQAQHSQHDTSSERQQRLRAWHTAQSFTFAGGN